MKKIFLISLGLSFFLISCNSKISSNINDSLLNDQFSLPTSTVSIFPSSTLSPQATQTPSPTQTQSPTLVPMDSFMQGVSFPSYFDGEYARPNADWLLENQVKPSGVNWISVHFFCYQDISISFEIICGTDHLTTKEDVKHIVENAHKRGFRVFLEIAIEVRNDPGLWSGLIGTGFNENDWKEWFENYEIYISEYANLAEELDIDMFSIGSELAGTTHREEEWRNVAKTVREVYSGPILFSSGDTGGELWLYIKWWDAVDAIGIHPYDTPLSNNYRSTVEEMVAHLSPFVDRLETISEKFNKPVIITELGIHSIDGISRGMAVLWEPGFKIKVNLQEQADVFQAYFEAFKDKEWWDGVFWFYVDLTGSGSNIDFSFYGKPAENIMRSYYGAPPRPTPTIIPQPNLLSMNSHNIFIEEFQNGWELQTSTFKVDIDQHEISKSGKDIKITFGAFDTAWLFFPSRINISQYEWLSFDIYSPLTEVWDSNKRNYSPVIINVLQQGYKIIASPYSANITQDSPFIEGRNLEAGKWQQVLIPLDAFGPFINPRFEHIVIANNSPYSITIYIDNIQLHKEKMGLN